MSSILANEQRIGAGLDLALQANEVFDKGPEYEEAFQALRTAAGLLILKDNDSCEFINGSEGADALGPLSHAYRKKIMASHSDVAQATHDFAPHGRWLEDAGLPEVRYFGTRLAALAPYFDAMQHDGAEPEVVFVPQLQLEGWHDIMQAYGWDGEPCEGIAKSWPASSLISTPRHNTWDVAIINGTIAPMPPEEIKGTQLEWSAPSLNTYISLQWLRRMRSKQPIDYPGATLLQERIKTPRGEQALIAEWVAKYGKIGLNGTDPNARQSWSFYARRPTKHGNDVV